MDEKIVKDSQCLAKDLVNDCISRYGVSAWLDNMGYSKLADVVMDKDRFPSAQPEIAERTTETAQNVSDGDLISRKAAIERIDEALSRVIKGPCGEKILARVPSAQPERKRGKWKMDLKRHVFVCSICGAWQVFNCNFCPNCGADMREVDDERPD